MYITMYFAALFILYETYRIVDARRLSDTINGLARARMRGDEDPMSTVGVELKDLAVLATLDLAYFIFSIVLLFTVWWYVGVVIIALGLSHYLVSRSAGRSYHPKVMRFDSIICIVMLSLIILF